jgi:hypothetical protein
MIYEHGGESLVEATENIEREGEIFKSDNPVPIRLFSIES